MTGEEGDIFSCDDLDLEIGARVFFSREGMVSLISLVYNIGYLRFQGGMNGIRGILGVSSENGNSDPS